MVFNRYLEVMLLSGKRERERETDAPKPVLSQLAQGGWIHLNLVSAPLSLTFDCHNSEEGYFLGPMFLQGVCACLTPTAVLGHVMVDWSLFKAVRANVCTLFQLPKLKRSRRPNPLRNFLSC